jgi:[ribosomal protein S5]-alanine N-acetyltransferase
VPSLVGPALPAGSLRVVPQPRITLAGGLELRPWRFGDVPALRAAFAAPDIRRWHVRTLDDDAEARRWVDAWAERWERETDASWAVVRRDAEDVVLGQAGLRTIRLAAASAQVSYWVRPEARGAGVATTAAAGVRSWAMGRIGLRRVYLEHSVLNEPSCRVAEAAGFRAEGTLRDYLLHADGWHDVHVHSSVPRDFVR